MVAVQDPGEGAADAVAVVEAGRDQRLVEVAVGGVVLGAAQAQRAVCGGGEFGGVVGGDLLERPDAVEVAEVAVLVGVVEAGPGPFGECAVGVDPVRREGRGQGAPAVGVLRVVGGGGEQGVPGCGEVHGRVESAPAAAGGAVLG